MLATVLIACLPLLAKANPLKRWITGSADAGMTTTDIYPPPSTSVDTALFPPESVVGYPGPTPTGAEAWAVQTAAAYPYLTGDVADFPLVVPAPLQAGNDSFNILRSWGNLSPVQSEPSAWGLPGSSPLAPDSCSVTQIHLLYRHGARYPTSGSAPFTFAEKIQNATKTGFEVWSSLSFLADWEMKIGAELLTPFGRGQNFNLGVQYRQLYAHLLNNFTEAGTLPVFRTESEDRMVKTANNFAAGFFGVPEYLNEVSIELMVEAPSINNTGAPYEICSNANVATRGGTGTTASNDWFQYAFNDTIARFNSQSTGINFTWVDIESMLQLRAYETNALGYSKFCELFTIEEFENFEYSFDLSFYYSYGFGATTSAAQGKGLLEEFVARFEQQLPSPNSTVNATLDDNSQLFPLDQSIYADATHEVVICATLAAFNFSAIQPSEPLPLFQRAENSPWVASKIVPFATHFTVQVMECSDMTPTKQIRFLLNDAVLPIDQTYEGCSYNKDGLCSFENVIVQLRKRIDEINFNGDCFGNFTGVLGKDYNGRFNH